MIAQFKSNMCQNVIFSFVMMECSSQPDVSQCCQQITETRKGGSEGGGNVCACACVCVGVCVCVCVCVRERIWLGVVFYVSYLDSTSALSRQERNQSC